MYDVIVIGGGHAGSEAVLASARLNKKTLLATGNFQMVASMPCNPSVGGPAKGIVVREIDALGGEMGKNADKTSIQFRMLNSSKGPAVRALRVQSDKIKYAKEMQNTISNNENITVKEGYVKSLIVEDGEIKGVLFDDESQEFAKKVIITTGTYMMAKILVGKNTKLEGPDEQKPSIGLSDSLRDLGFEIIRLKTGTPARIYKDSIDFSKAVVHNGDEGFLSFSYETKETLPLEKQVPCHLIHTTLDTKKIIVDNLNKSSMYSGVVEGVGPRYCPSIEDKIVRFADKDVHQIFLEPESLELDTIYVQGFSTSMPHEIQDLMIHSLPGLENARIKKYAYAIEYDAINPMQLKPSLESKLVKGLYFGGQVNGTSGYEEAACQGLIAGINAALSLDDKEPLILKRDEAYIGVLIDDLVTKGVKDPYRLLTSRAEHRLLLRHDNADIRLTKHGHDVGLISDERYDNYLYKINKVEEIKEYLASTKLNPTKEVNSILRELNVQEMKDQLTLYDLLKRPDISLDIIYKIMGLECDLPIDYKEQIEIDIKYEGYIKKALKQAQDLTKYDNVSIPENIDYNQITNIAKEARDKLMKVRPLTIGQASRISGVNPADIQILLIYMKTLK